MKLNFTGKTALVTGGSRGIGHQVARDLLACGAEVIVTSRKASDEEKVLAGLGPGARHMAVDLSVAEEARSFAGRVKELPKLDICVNNAGVARHGLFQDVTEEDWDVTNDVNLKGPFLVSQAAAAGMRERGYGRIVNISSLWGHITRQGRSVYTATKHGVNGLTLTYALELARDGVLVNVVSPGYTLTDMARQNYSTEQLDEIAERIPIGRFAQPEEISRAILFLASDLNTYITGHNLIVDGGYSIP